MLADCIVNHSSLNESSDSSTPNAKHSLLIGQSFAHRRLLDQIERMREPSASVLITGESGTGKELVARELYLRSLARRNGTFEGINCGAIPENLLESELFGHKKGAFTDAKADKKGLFEICSDGVLFLDEVGEMPLQLQVKLLRVLQEKEVRPLGATKTIAINTRIVAATNRDLLHEVAEGRFRLDLYYRLSVLKIHLLPLRERKADISILVEHFINKFARENGKYIRPLTEPQMQQIVASDWPGNVRELQNAIERAVILAQNGAIDMESIIESKESAAVDVLEDQLLCLDKLPLRHSDAKKVFEVCYLSNLLRHTNGNITEAAKVADKTRVEIYRYLARNNIAPQNFRCIESQPYGELGTTSMGV